MDSLIRLLRLCSVKVDFLFWVPLNTTLGKYFKIDLDHLLSNFLPIHHSPICLCITCARQNSPLLISKLVRINFVSFEFAFFFIYYDSHMIRIYHVCVLCAQWYFEAVLLNNISALIYPLTFQMTAFFLSELQFSKWIVSFPTSFRDEISAWLCLSKFGILRSCATFRGLHSPRATFNP